MNTLSNVETRRDEAYLQSVRPISVTIPQAMNTTTGVSVDYVPNATKSWFVLRASYGREDKAAEVLIEDGTYAYVAKRYTRKLVKGEQKKVLESLIPNLLFVYTTPQKADEYVKSTPKLSYLTFYYNHFARNSEGTNPPLLIPRREMENFILATCTHNEHLMSVTESQCHFKGGETVRVIDGAFKGVVGRVARVAGQSRVVISLSDVGLISTAYVPKDFLEVVDCP